jgi:putative ATP-dependent endonuclease of OLD family
MKLIAIELENFRCYKDKVHISIGNLTTFVGKNDIGKSTILEALEIFFNNQSIKCELGDLNVFSNHSDINITCEFAELPQQLSVDAGAETSLDEEFLLTEQKTLKIKKIWDCSKKAVSSETFIIAYHPSKPGIDNLLELKEKELQGLIKAGNLDVKLKGNPGMRKALWDSAGELELKEILIPVSKSKEDSKRIWEQIESHLPIFALFQSDRNSQDSDSEIQNPMKAAIATAIAEVQDDIEKIQEKVRIKAEEIAANTHKALNSIDSTLAQKLIPSFTPPTTSKWTSLFSVGLETDDGIPLNKRGSGIRRLILVSFFKAEAERRLTISNRRSIIYALEEPETAQHPKSQKILIESFKTLASEEGCQVILTTHSPGLAAELPSDSIRFVNRDSDANPIITEGANIFEEVAEILGVTPDSRVKLLICVEGPTDVKALKHLSSALHIEDETIPDLSTDNRIAFVTLGGSTLQNWVSNNYLKGLSKPEFHIYDNDKPEYQKSVDMVNNREDDSWATLTGKYEIECYLHEDAIFESCGIKIVVEDVPVIGPVDKQFADAWHIKYGQKINEKTAKKYVQRAFESMDAKRIKDRDKNNDIETWLRQIATVIS